MKARDIPYECIKSSIESGTDKNILFLVGGGLGDRICAEPTIRYALETFKGINISIACETPELFNHLKFKEVFDFKKTYPVTGRHLCIDTYPAPHKLINQFMSPNLMSTVDYASLSALRCILPRSYKAPKLFTVLPTIDLPEKSVVLHVGKSWESRTFPAKWWNTVLSTLKRTGMNPVLVGNNCIDIDSDGIWDLREMLSMNDFIGVCQNAYAIITNDSSPVHIGATGKAMIAFVPTVRRPDYLMHHRNGGFGWKTMAFYDQPYWELLDSCPNHLATKGIDKIPEGHKITDFLPNPKTIVEWIITE